MVQETFLKSREDINNSLLYKIITLIIDHNKEALPNPTLISPCINYVQYKGGCAVLLMAYSISDAHLQYQRDTLPLFLIFLSNTEDVPL